MFSYVLSSASTYFHLPIDEDDSDDPDLTAKHISWVPSDPTDSDDSDAPPVASSSSSSSRTTHSEPVSPSAKRSKTVINEILAHDDLYQVLGIHRSSRIDKLTLRRAYLSRSKACHPDKFPGNPQATCAFQKVSVAYDVLSKPSSKRSYDARPPHTPYDFFSSRPFPQAEETFRSVVIGVFNDMLDGDLEMIRTLLKAVNDMNPSLRLGEDGINAVLLTLHSIRDRALTCRTCILALHMELTRLLEAQRAFRQLSYFDIRRRSCLTLQIARLTVGLPIALERALQRRQVEDMGCDVAGDDRTAILNRRVYSLLRSLVAVLERMERVLR